MFSNPVPAYQYNINQYKNQCTVYIVIGILRYKCLFKLHLGFTIL